MSLLRLGSHSELFKPTHTIITLNLFYPNSTKKLCPL